MESKQAILDSLNQAVAQNALVKMTISKPVRKSENLQNIYIREVEIKEETLLQWVYRYKTQDQTKNYSLEESLELLEDLLYKDFRAAIVFTLEKDQHFLISKKGKLSQRTTAPTFKNKPEPINDRQKIKRIPLDRPYLKALGIADEQGKLVPKMADKYRQINKYIEIVEGLVLNAKLPDSAHFVDMGSGKGYLTFALFDFLQNTMELDIRMTGVELREELVDFCNDIAKKVGFDKLNFVAERIENFEGHQIDVLIALHACDTATDDALFAALQAKSSLIITAPCCHKQVRQQTKGKESTNPLLKYGIFKERSYEMLTDTIRALLLEREGYRTKIFEFISNEHTRKNVMLVAHKSNSSASVEEIDQRIAGLKKEYHVEYQYLERKLGLS